VKRSNRHKVMLDTEELGFGKRVVLSEPTRRIRLEAFMAGIKGAYGDRQPAVSWCLTLVAPM
jgi:hypothetical protein